LLQCKGLRKTTMLNMWQCMVLLIIKVLAHDSACMVLAT